jgi:hypothetical protein
MRELAVDAQSQRGDWKGVLGDKLLGPIVWLSNLKPVAVILGGGESELSARGRGRSVAMFGVHKGRARYWVHV